MCSIYVCYNYVLVKQAIIIQLWVPIPNAQVYKIMRRIIIHHRVRLTSYMCTVHVYG